PAVDVLVDLTQRKAAMGVPPLACAGRVHRAFRVAAVVAIDAVLDLLHAGALAEGESDDAGAANAIVVAHEPAAELEADAVEAAARHGTTVIESLRPHSDPGAAFPYLVQVIRQCLVAHVDRAET